MPLADSGDRTALPTGAVRDLAPGRGRFDLLSPIALEELAKLAEAGAIKYGRRGPCTCGIAPHEPGCPALVVDTNHRNWEKGFPLSSFMNSAMRHLNSLAAGRNNEDHATAVMWNMMAFVHTRRLIELGVLPTDLAEGWLPAGLGLEQQRPTATPPALTALEDLAFGRPPALTALDDIAFGRPPHPRCQSCKGVPDERTIVPTNADAGVWMHHDCWCWTNEPTATD